MTVYTLVCYQADLCQEVFVCDKHSQEMPPVDNERVFAAPCDDDVACEFCANPAPWQ